MYIYIYICIYVSWAIMGHHGLFLTTEYIIWFLEAYSYSFGVELYGMFRVLPKIRNL